MLTITKTTETTKNGKTTHTYTFQFENGKTVVKNHKSDFTHFVIDTDWFHVWNMCGDAEKAQKAMQGVISRAGRGVFPKSRAKAARIKCAKKLQVVAL